MNAPASKHLLSRRETLIASTAIGLGSVLDTDAHARDHESRQATPSSTLQETSLGTKQTVTVERREKIVLIGLNRPDAGNRIDPITYDLLSKYYFEFDHDSSLRVAVLFGHGDNFSQGIDVEAFAPLIKSNADRPEKAGTMDPWGRAGPRVSKPVVVVAHGDTLNVGHELCLSADIRVASANARFAQTENTHARLPASGSTIRFVREAGWAQAMRYLLTGDSWTAEDAVRMGLFQAIAPTPAAARELGVRLAEKIAACAPLSIRTTLASAHLAIDEGEKRAFAALPRQRSALYKTRDFAEGLTASKEHRLPTYHDD
jgi:enoyl-CoA hydratase/carnithine racemase